MKYTKNCFILFTSVLCLSLSMLSVNNLFVGHEDIDYENDALKLSINKLGSCSWYHTWGGNESDFGNGVAFDSSDNIYITGRTYGEIPLVKYNPIGVQQWNLTWSGDSGAIGYALAIDSLNNTYIVGNYHSDLFLLKINSSGVEEWNLTWSEEQWGTAYGISLDSSDNIYITGWTNNNVEGSTDMVLVKYNSSGAEQWFRMWGGGSHDEFGRGLAIDSSDNIYVTGFVNDEDNQDMFLVKYDSSGAQKWHRTWGGSDDDYGYGVAVDSSDEIYVTGTTQSYGSGFDDIFLVKYGIHGAEEWFRTWGGSNSDYGYGATIDSLDNIYITGYTGSFGLGKSDILLVKYDSAGTEHWCRTWGGSENDRGNAVAVDSSDNVYIVGETESYGMGDWDMVLVKFSPLDQITINSPVQNEFIGSKSPEFDISIFESDVNTTWYTLDDGDINITFSGFTGTIDQAEWDKKGNGAITIRFYANNTLGEEGYSEVSVVKDINNPMITINNPSQEESFRSDPPDYDISIVEPNLDSIWYTLNGGINNFTITQTSGTINQTAWNGAHYGNVTIRFNAKDFAGNLGYREVIVVKVKGQVIYGYSPFLLMSVIGVITVILLKKKYFN